jgi:transposase-like protein
MLSERRDEEAATAFFKQAINNKTTQVTCKVTN